jgi:hypothetical protein
MDTTQIGPDGQPAIFDGGAWYSSDRRYEWDGSDWVRSHRPGEGLSFAHVGFAAIFVSVIAYAIYTMVSTESVFKLGFYLGAISFFGVLLLVFLFAGRWGWIGSIVRVLCVGLALLKFVTLIFNPPAS